MSRRMLLEDDSNNGLMPVTDGLIGWYDARDRNVDNTYLIDKSNNGNNISCKSNQCIIHDDYIDVLTQASSEELNYSTYINGELTILYCINTTNSQDHTYAQLKCMSGMYTNNLGWWIKPDSNLMNVWYNNKKLIGDTDNKFIIPKEKIVVAMILSSTKVSVYINGVLFASKSLDNINVSNLSLGLFGHYGYRNSVIYKYYSSYIYNRALTEEEIQQNYLYEQSIERYPKIVLCENYSPNGQPFYLWQDKPIYLGESELYLNVDLSTCGTNGFEKVISLGVGDIMAWNGGKKIHIYYNKPTNVLRVQYMNNTTKYSVDKKNNNDTINNFEIVVCKNGIYLNNMPITNPNDSTLKTVNTALLSESIDIGASGTYVVYNLVCLREYQKRGE